MLENVAAPAESIYRSNPGCSGHGIVSLTTRPCCSPNIDRYTDLLASVVWPELIYSVSAGCLHMSFISLAAATTKLTKTAAQSGSTHTLLQETQTESRKPQKTHTGADQTIGSHFPVLYDNKLKPRCHWDEERSGRIHKKAHIIMNVS